VRILVRESLHRSLQQLATRSTVESPKSNFRSVKVYWLFFKEISPPFPVGDTIRSLSPASIPSEKFPPPLKRSRPKASFFSCPPHDSLFFSKQFYEPFLRHINVFSPLPTFLLGAPSCFAFPLSIAIFFFFLLRYARNAFFLVGNCFSVRFVTPRTSPPLFSSCRNRNPPPLVTPPTLRCFFRFVENDFFFIFFAQALMRLTTVKAFRSPLVLAPPQRKRALPSPPSVCRLFR